MWNEALKKYPIIFFDATGNVHQDIKNQSKPLLYSMVFRDLNKKLIVPLAEFLTTSHDQINISKFLLSIKSKLDNNEVPKIVVTDMSWALMNSIMFTFNQCTISNYLSWCFNYLYKQSQINNLPNLIKTKMYLCSTHYLHNLIKKVKKIQTSEKSRKFFIFMFTLI